MAFSYYTAGFGFCGLCSMQAQVQDLWQLGRVRSSKVFLFTKSVDPVLAIFPIQMTGLLWAKYLAPRPSLGKAVFSPSFSLLATHHRWPATLAKHACSSLSVIAEAQQRRWSDASLC